MIDVAVRDELGNDVRIENPDGTRVERRRALIDSKYQSADTSGLSFTVDGTTRRFDIPVDRATR